MKWGGVRLYLAAVHLLYDPANEGQCDLEGGLTAPLLTLHQLYCSPGERGVEDWVKRPLRALTTGKRAGLNCSKLRDHARSDGVWGAQSPTGVAVMVLYLP